MVEAAIGVWFLCGIAAMMIANNKGRSGCGWFLLGVLFGPFGILFAAIVPSEKKSILDAEAPTPQTHVRCPDCKELVRKDARKCKHCGATLTPVEITSTGVRPAVNVNTLPKQAPPQMPPEYTAKQNRQILLVVVILVIFVAAMLALSKSGIIQ